MAAADYRLCDVCGAKTFYDEALRYDFEEHPIHGLRLGAWAVICEECAKTFEVVVRPRVTPEQLTVAAAAMHAAEVPDEVIGALTRQP